MPNAKKKKKTPLSLTLNKNRILRFEMREPKRLTPWDKNPRKNEAAVARLVTLIKAHGFVNPIIVDKKYIIRAGHTRHKAALKAKLDKVPVLVYDFKSAKEAELYAVSDNRSSEWAQWDEHGLQEIFAHLQAAHKMDAEVVAKYSGFTERELQGLESGAHTNFAEDTFKEAIEEFEKTNPKTVETPHWFWMVIPNREVFELMRERYCAKGRGREMLWQRYLNTLKAGTFKSKLKRALRNNLPTHNGEQK